MSIQDADEFVMAWTSYAYCDFKIPGLLINLLIPVYS